MTTTIPDPSAARVGVALLGFHVDFYRRVPDEERDRMWGDDLDTTNHGLSSRYPGATIVGIVDRTLDALYVGSLDQDLLRRPVTDKAPAVWLQHNRTFGRSTWAIIPALPAAAGTDDTPTMRRWVGRWAHGGSYACSIDSRFSRLIDGVHAIPVFDRSER